MTSSTPAKADSRELGQTLPLVIVFLVVLLLMCGAVVDIGNAYRAQNALQASADAAATAAADNLPDVGAASTAGHDFSSEPGGKNTVPGVSNVNTDIVTNCATSPKFCDPANTVQVTETGVVPTFFLKVIGINSIPETVHATACSPCGGVPLDIMIVLDRTGSMQGQKLQNAKQGVSAFLSSLDPTIDNVGLAVLPPAPAPGTDCNIPSGNSYNSLNSQYLLVPLTSAWGTEVNNQVQLDQTSPLLSTLNCIQAGGSTAYADAIDAAQQELTVDGRPNVQKVIVFLSDGAANTGPTYYPATSPYRTQPCQQGVNSAADAKGQGTLVYSILYDTNDAGSPLCQAQGGAKEQPQMYSTDAMQQIASPGNYYNQPNPTQLTTIFLAISADLTAGTSRLTN